MHAVVGVDALHVCDPIAFLSGNHFLTCVLRNHGKTCKGTIDADQLLTPISAATAANYPCVLHGCPAAAWLMIKETGLNRMGRQHV
jgi:hypothetical protein